jgi:hypothetical protein
VDSWFQRIGISKRVKKCHRIFDSWSVLQDIGSGLLYLLVNDTKKRSRTSRKNRTVSYSLVDYYLRDTTAQNHAKNKTEFSTLHRATLKDLTKTPSIVGLKNTFWTQIQKGQGCPFTLQGFFIPASLFAKKDQ